MTPAPERWGTPANVLSASRLIAVIPCVYGILAEQPVLAAAAFAIAVATDVIDGRVARHRDEVSALGGLLDHGCDALFVAAALCALALQDLVPVLLSPLLLAAFAQYALDSRALRGQTLRGSSLGRWNGIAYYALAGIVIVRDALAMGWPPDAWIRMAGWTLVASTVLSMLQRYRAT